LESPSYDRDTLVAVETDQGLIGGMTDSQRHAHRQA
jgi:hypothetical protein